MLAALQHEHEFFEELGYLIGFAAGNTDFISPNDHAGIGECLLDLPHEFVTGAHERRHEM